MAKCKICGKTSHLISSFLGICVGCIREDFDKALPYIQKAHIQARQSFKLPPRIPCDPEGKNCNICINACRVKNKDVGFCALPVDSRNEASLTWYYDPLPTNCVADWVCGGSCDFGYKNLAVFYNACNFDCLFCQNWHFKESDLSEKISAEELAEKVDEKTSCICYFGGDPTPQIPHSISVSRIARRARKAKRLRICWETNGSMEPEYLRQMLEISLESGGCIKFDLKSWSGNLNIALCGTSNKRTLENFKLAAGYIGKRPDPPLLVASTLLVPGYLDLYELEKIAKFVADINPSIPYGFLAFHPQFMMKDLPVTSHSHAQKAKEATSRVGLKNVRIGNVHLLQDTYSV